MGSRFLIRFDDICPRMNWTVWNQVERILVDADVRPLLAVVPDNRDPLLDKAAADPRFWEKVRGWQAAGWSIGLHGYQHCYVTASAGIIGRNRYSEFAGLPAAEQEWKLRAGLAIFRGNGVRAEAWVAPAHSFDEVTLDGLRRSGIGVVSDGYALNPFVCQRGLLWIPQQVARFRPFPFGTWTVCHHVNDWTDADIARFARDIARYRASITGLREIRDQFAGRQEAAQDRLLGCSIRAARWLKTRGGLA